MSSSWHCNSVRPAKSAAKKTASQTENVCLMLNASAHTVKQQSVPRVRLQRQKGVGARWQKTVHEYRSQERVSDMFVHVPVQVSPVGWRHNMGGTTALCIPNSERRALKASVRHAWETLKKGFKLGIFKCLSLKDVCRFARAHNNLEAAVDGKSSPTPCLRFFFLALLVHMQTLSPNAADRNAADTS